MAIVGASLALLVVQGTRAESVGRVLQDIDWKTLLFLVLLFSLVEAFNRTGVLQSLSGVLHASLGTQLLAVALVLLLGVAVSSTLLANIPVVAAMVLLVKGYLIIAGLVPSSRSTPPTPTGRPRRCRYSSR